MAAPSTAAASSRPSSTRSSRAPCSRRSRAWTSIPRCCTATTGTRPLCRSCSRPSTPDSPQGGLKTLLTLHNLAYQGSYDHGLLHDLLGIGHEYAGVDQIGHFGQDNLLKAGIRYADAVNTVSPTYAREICTPQFGETLEGVLAERGSGLTGILNGIDTQVWDPACDGLLPPSGTYTASDLAGKALCKAALQRELGLDPNPAAPLIAMVGRLTPQKGIDLVDAALDRLMERGVQLAILGSGYPCYEESLREAENRYPGRVCSYIGYNGALSHRMYAGADLFLMPSAFEPCGISQMIAMRYGALPIVREAGGLRDTVVPYNRFTGAGTGFSFADYSADVLLQTVDRALEAWHDDPVRDAAHRAGHGGRRGLLALRRRIPEPLRKAVDDPCPRPPAM